MVDDRDDIRRTFQSIASEAFPDDTDVHWHIREIVEKSGFFCVEAEPVPATVGYPRFRFVLARGPGRSGDFRDLGCYCLDGGAWTLLYTAPGSSKEWRALEFDKAF
jgi:hypothetical protein